VLSSRKNSVRYCRMLLCHGITWPFVACLMNWLVFPLNSKLTGFASLNLASESDAHTHKCGSILCMLASFQHQHQEPSLECRSKQNCKVLIASGLLLLPSLPSRSMQQIMTSCRVCGGRFWRLGGAQTSDETNMILVCTPASMATTSPSLGRRFCKVDLDRVP